MPPPSNPTASPIAHRSRWSTEETLLLLELLLEARRDQQFNNERISTVRDVLRGFVPIFSSEFPHRQWNVKAIENRWIWLRGIWQAFRAAEARPGTTYNDWSGMLQMSKQSAAVIESIHKLYGRYVITKRLPTNDNISRSEWEEIFSTPLSVARPAASSSRNTPSSIARSVASSSRNTPATPTPSNGPPNRSSRSLQQERIMAQSSELSQIISNVLGPGPRERIIHPRAPGADDIEKASKDCQLLFEEFGIHNMVKVIMWLKENAMNPPIWNSLSSKEAKMVLIETILGVELSR
ncbi:hypothetical protein E4U09_007355 [Claviceps aff. purpurea]|uniref:Myb/SANT-like domain-containing protein n=1 Tax=Claviceps aff. purpurea TaxID=1967640 RepID=A0A9P7TVM6_9HYPO|nr:hypothetical protein E4U09_007355 [Claviceps aff. purpurea]